MEEQSTGRDGATTDERIRDAYVQGLTHGIARGAIMALTPYGKRAADRRQRARIAARMAEYAAVPRRDPHRFWPDLMPGGWPLPPEIPDPDESTYWPEVDGWPCPPPALRGGTA